MSGYWVIEHVDTKRRDMVWMTMNKAVFFGDSKSYTAEYIREHYYFLYQISI